MSTPTRTVLSQNWMYNFKTSNVETVGSDVHAFTQIIKQRRRSSAHRKGFRRLKKG